jgi:hypothetical protein
MRLHTSLSEVQVMAALQRAKDAGHVAEDVSFTILSARPSRTHTRQFEVQLGVDKSLPYKPLPDNYVNQYGKRQKTRRSTNGSARTWAATWHEWGWFMAEAFEADPDSRWGDDPNRAKHPWGYFDQSDFDQKTEYAFCLDPA